MKAVSRDGTIADNKAQFRMNQVYAATEHYVLLEVEFDKAPAAGAEQDFGIVKVAYTDARSGETQTLDTAIRARFSASEEEVRANTDTKVGEVVLEQVARARAREAVILRDQGQHEQARQLLLQNATEINAFSSITPGVTRELIDLGKQYEALGAATPLSARCRSAPSAKPCANSTPTAPAPDGGTDRAGVRLPLPCFFSMGRGRH